MLLRFSLEEVMAQKVVRVMAVFQVRLMVIFLIRISRVLDRGAELIREMLEQGIERDEMIERFTAEMRAGATAQGLDEEQLRAYELANPRTMSVDGIARYWRKRGLSPGPPSV